MRRSIALKALDERDTVDAGERLGTVLVKGDTVCLHGDLGAGKTTFVKGIARGLGIDEREITSASFVIVAEHYGRMPLYHIDLYRVVDDADLAGLGLEEYLDGDGVAVVEWAERLGGWDCTFRVRIRFMDDAGREILIDGDAERIGRLEER
ncbi:MAG: tRNA (adenosine(37)-N6)-threonylcarbamoyltransferase complex ATPase subunit type 1 TsaE [Nitrospirae bacterium]|nr:tRNA (adenosine(37)-N6)-threonylcarbamoyltransferase complex ATPase subunit type 1 TsaE [Nitrospirota bacterium]